MRLAPFGLALLLLAPSARAQNLVPDPAFTAGVGAWQPAGIAGTFTMAFAHAVTVRPGSGSALFTVGSPAGGAFTVCVAVQPNRPYEWGHWTHFPDAAKTAGLGEVLDIRDGPACTGSSIGGVAQPIVAGPIGSWSGGLRHSFTTPAAARSIRAGFSASGAGGSQALVYVDDVYLAIAGTVPPVDPPLSAAANVPALAPLAAAALAAALAWAGARGVRA